MMRAKPLFDAKIAFLEEHSAHTSAHSSSSLLRHLLGTYEILHGWGMRPALCNAGLFHSIYGTETYRHTSIPPSLRARLRDLIGDEAEALVHIFCRMMRGSLFENLARPSGFSIRCRLSGEAVPLDVPQLVDLYHLSAANWLEQRPRFPPELQAERCAEYRALRRFVCERAQAAIDEAYGFEPECTPLDAPL
jgi:hypothetical protein